ncbi:MAG: DUF917 domain-containing protein [Acetobacteraceae bacterium]|nr:DUF917 domain-containing protein [Acetobacteraceae bacterium]
MAAGKLRDIRSCEALVRGLTLFGSGGGGAPQVGLRYLQTALEEGREPAWVEAAGLPHDCLTASVAGLGGRAPRVAPTAEELAVMGSPERRLALEDCVVAAAAALEEHSGLRLGAVVPIELGGSNTPIAMLAASRLGLPVVDGDYAGRAVPELSQTTVGLKGGTPYPAAVADQWGNVTILVRGTGFGAADRLARHLCAAAYGPVGVALYLLRAARARAFLVPGTISRALEVGLAMQQAAASGRSPMPALEAAGARLAFQGRVDRAEWLDEAGYMFSYGQIEVAGGGDFGGRRLRIWYKNEFHVTWCDGSPYVTSPDVIAVIDRESGWPCTYAQVQPGMEVLVVCIPCLEKAYRSPRGLDLLGPRHFGFDIEYRPAEEVVPLTGQPGRAEGGGR